MMVPPTCRTWESSFADRRQNRSIPLRTQSESKVETEVPKVQNPKAHARHQSTATAAALARLNALPESPVEDVSPRSSLDSPEAIMLDDSGVFLSVDVADAAGALTPPATPVKPHETASANHTKKVSNTLLFDFTKIDYELERARKLGSGLWSSVYLADPVQESIEEVIGASMSPPITPQRRMYSSASLFAVKVPARPDAREVIRQEAKMLTLLQRHPSANQYVVGFHGLDERNSALVLEAVIGGSLENLVSRLNVMTELARHLELIDVFPGLARDLVTGLEFIHTASVVHADIKPANVLLDISNHFTLPKPVIRARFIDFSASFRPEQDDMTNGGGTWDYMAPEQMRIQKDLNTPTFASDIWSLGITLLSIIVGGSPYTATCGGNNFMLREAIKRGDPLSFARMDPVVHKRMATCQDFVDCCRLALHKDRQRRTTAAAWRTWLASHDIGSL